jgi:hypothetical protein
MINKYLYLLCQIESKDYMLSYIASGPQGSEMVLPI